MAHTLQSLSQAIHLTNDGLNVGSETDFGVVMHGKIARGDFQSADELFQSLDRGDHGYVRPGPTCFNSLILGCIQARRWEDAINCYDRMVDRDIQPLSSSYAGLVLASFRASGNEGARSFLKRAVTSKAQFSGETALLAMKLLIPAMADETNTRNIRMKLRQMADERQTESRETLLQLIRVIREAEIEEDEEAEQPLGIPLEGNRWRVVMSKLADEHLFEQ